MGKHQELTLVAAADKSYAVQLDVMLTSVRVHLPASWRITAVVMSADLTSDDVQWRVRHPADTVTCVPPPLDNVESLPIRPGDHLSLATYYRLYLADVVPDSVRRVVYLDSDLVVLHDLSELATVGLGGKTVGAVQSFSDPFLRAAGPAFATVPCGEGAPYFNAGVLAIDVERWRSQGVKQRAIGFLERHYGDVRFWDQDALNYALIDDWQQMDLRWNRTSDYHRSGRDMPPPPFTREAWQSLARPYVTHFVSGYKPWTHYGHPDKATYDRYLRMAGHGATRMTLLKAIRRRIGR